MISLLKSVFSRLTTRRAFLISPHTLAAYHWHNNRLHHTAYLFDRSHRGLDAFKRYLGTVRNDPVHILLDLPTEEHRRITIPPIRGHNRKALIGRKAAHCFGDVPWFASHLQGRETTGRRDLIVALSAITDAQAIKPWLDQLDARQVPVAGMSSLPLLPRPGMDIFSDMPPRLLVFSLQSASGLRQSFFQDKALAFSRLIKMPDDGIERLAFWMAAEFAKLDHYIQGTYFSAHDESLVVYILGNRELLDALGKRLTDSTTRRFHFIDIDRMASACGLARPSNTFFSDRYWVYHLLNRTPQNRYATAQETRHFRRQRITRRLRIAGMAIFLAGMFWGSMTTFEGLSYQRQHIADTKRTDFYLQRLEHAQQKLAAFPIDAATLQAAINAKKQLETDKSNPLDMLRFISRGLDNFPEIHAQQIEWTSTAKWAGDPDSVADNSAGNAAARYQTALFEGYMTDFDGHYRNAFETIRRFAAFLRRQEAVHTVRIVQLPIDLSPEASVQGAADSIAERANFLVEIIINTRSEV